MTFGDADPDDAFVATDPIPVRVRNIARRVEWAIYELAGQTPRSAVAARLARLLEDLRTIRDELEA